MSKFLERIAEFTSATDGIVSKEFREWLMKNGFFNAPASTKYHGNYEGGLFDHSFEVMGCLMEMTAKLDLGWQRKESPVIVGLFHDLCKIDEYVKVVDEEGQVMMGTGEVKGEIAHFEHASDVLLKGHGDKSIMLLSQFMTLTEEEIMWVLTTGMTGKVLIKQSENIRMCFSLILLICMLQRFWNFET
jgi:hypothetical protein